MITDYALWFNTYGTPQAETSIGQYDSNNVYDMTVVDKNIITNGYLVFQIVVAITAATETLQIDLVCSAAAALTTPTILWGTGVLATATIEAWEANSIVYVVKIPPNIPLRYLGMSYTIAADDFDTGSWNCFITPNAPQFIAADPTATS